MCTGRPGWPGRRVGTSPSSGGSCTGESGSGFTGSSSSNGPTGGGTGGTGWGVGTEAKRRDRSDGERGSSMRLHSRGSRIFKAPAVSLHHRMARDAVVAGRQVDPKKMGRSSCKDRPIHLVRLAGIEPTTPWFVAKYSIQLSYSREALDHTPDFNDFEKISNPEKKMGRPLVRTDPFGLVRLAGIEPTTPWFVAKYSIQLSYSREAIKYSAVFNARPKRPPEFRSPAACCGCVRSARCRRSSPCRCPERRPVARFRAACGRPCAGPGP